MSGRKCSAMERALDLVKKGISYRKSAKECGVSLSGLAKAVKKEKEDTQKPG